MAEWSPEKLFPNSHTDWQFCGWICQSITLWVEERNLAAYRKLKKKIHFPDLCQYAKNGRARGELKDGSMMTLTTNCSSVFSEDGAAKSVCSLRERERRGLCRSSLDVLNWKQEFQRFASPTELLSTQVIPTTKYQSKLCGAPPLALDSVKSQRSIAKMAGNSMTVPILGFVMLAAALALEPIAWVETAIKFQLNSVWMYGSLHQFVWSQPSVSLLAPNDEKGYLFCLQSDVLPLPAVLLLKWGLPHSVKLKFALKA